MTKTQTYRLDLDGQPTATVQAPTPRAALKQHFGDDLAPGTGRYGRLTDGRACVALLIHAGRQYRGGHEWGN